MNDVLADSPEATADGREHGPPPIYVVSGATGLSGVQLVNTVLAQYPGAQVPLHALGGVRNGAQVAEAVATAAASGGVIVHTLVNAQLRRQLVEQADQAGVPAIDLMGPLMDRLTAVLGQEPLGQPGRYHQLHRSYFERVAAIEYAIRHNDGRNPDGWAEADVVLVGVSRTGKTPLSIYLSILGWKVANVPLVPEVPPPARLFELDPARVLGLTIDLDQLLAHRRERSSRLGTGRHQPYADPERVQEELQMARQVFRRGGFQVLNVTDRTVEANADEVIRRIARH